MLDVFGIVYCIKYNRPMSVDFMSVWLKCVHRSRENLKWMCTSGFHMHRLMTHWIFVNNIYVYFNNKIKEHKWTSENLGITTGETLKMAAFLNWYLVQSDLELVCNVPMITLETNKQNKIKPSANTSPKEIK